MKRIFMDSRLHGDEVMSAQAGAQVNATSALRPSTADMKNRTQTEEQPSARKKKQCTKRKVRALQARLGAPSETLLADPDAPHSLLRVFAYGLDTWTEQTLQSPQQVQGFLRDWPVTWVNVEGLGDVEVIKHLAEIFGLHWLAVEDVLQVDQRAKVEQYGTHHFIVARMIMLHELLETEQISMFLGQNFILTFQEGLPGDCLESVRERLRKEQHRIREAKADYLAYALLDAIVDNYFPVLEAYGERLETLEDEVIAHPAPDIITQIHDIKRDLLTLRRAIWPQREALNALLRDDLPLITPDTRLHLRDCYDHSVQLIDLVETYRQLCADLTDMYLSSLSNRTNEIMRVLTVIATIFIPLTFIVGVYGMNFNTEKSPWNMPELNWYWGYPYCLALMGLVVGCQLMFFWHKGWIAVPKFLQARAKKVKEKTTEGQS